MVGRNRSLHQQDYKEEVVYLFEPPRATYIPNISPFSLKLETWLRMNEIPYEVIFVDMLSTSKKGQLPFIELNGKEIADSNFIIAELAEHCKKEMKLDELQKATAQSFHSLIEDSLFWVLVANRSNQCDVLLSDANLIRMLPAPLRPIRALAAKVFSSKLKTKAFHQGIGRNSIEEINAIGCKLLRAVSTFLGDKDYLFGEKPTWIDATAFGHLSQFWYTPLNSEVKKLMETDCHNIVTYLERMKTAYWPDWVELCAAPVAKSTKEKVSKAVESVAEKVEKKLTDETQEEEKDAEKKVTDANVASSPTPQATAVESQ